MAFGGTRCEASRDRLGRSGRAAAIQRLAAIAATAALGLAGLHATGGVLAQDDAQLSIAPPAGLSVQVAGDRGVVQLTVYGMADTEIAARADDDDGATEYILVELDVENVGDTPFAFNSTRITLHDANGATYKRVTFDDDDDDLGQYRPLRGQELDGDDRDRGWLAFAVDAGVALEVVSYRDDDGDDVGIADLTLPAIVQADDDDRNDDGFDDDDGFGGNGTGGGGGGGNGTGTGGGGVPAGNGTGTGGGGGPAGNGTGGGGGGVPAGTGTSGNGTGGNGTGGGGNGTGGDDDGDDD